MHLMSWKNEDAEISFLNTECLKTTVP